MTFHNLLLLLGLSLLLGAHSSADQASPSTESSSGWVKYGSNPVLGGADLGTCFDVALLKEEDRYRMWLSWRPRHSIAHSESPDGIHWSEPKSVLLPDSRFPWEKDDLNRPAILKKDGIYHLWYTAQADGKSVISHATSPDGIRFTRSTEKPVMVPESPWEKVAVMCPHVEWDEETKAFRMWYSGGEQYEPNAIGYATSPDGIVWTRHVANPIFAADPTQPWERHKVTACQVVRHEGWWYMFYIGFENDDLARIGVARSKDGVTAWQRHPGNPIISPGREAWDDIGVYKPFAIYDPVEKIWRLWYNGRNSKFERIGLAIHAGEDLGFKSE